MDKSGHLDVNEFRIWLNKNTEILDGLENIFVQLAWDIPKHRNNSC